MRKKNSALQSSTPFLIMSLLKIVYVKNIVTCLLIYLEFYVAYAWEFRACCSWVTTSCQFYYVRKVIISVQCALLSLFNL